MLDKADLDKIEHVFELNKDLLKNFILKYVRNEEDAIEILQECFILVFQRLHKLGIKNNLRSYVFKTARNLSLNFIAHKRVHLKNIDALQKKGKRFSEFESQLLDSFELEWLESFMHKHFTEQEMNIFQKRYYEEKAIQQTNK